MNREQRCGFEALRQALDADEPVRVVLHRRGELTPSELDVLDRARAHGADVQAIGARELTRAAAVPGADVLVMIGPDPHAALDALLSRAGAIWLLVGTAYPGNAGFVIRSAEVSGAAGVVIDADFNRTARRDAGRAAMRADRMLPVLYADAAQVVERAMAAGHRIVAVEDSGECLPWDVDLTGAVLFLIGGEEHGVPEALLAEAHEVVRIPMQGFMRSYNLQAAMAAVMAERLRQQGAPATNRSD
jgi:TrmH family RNA methyltransferase